MYDLETKGRFLELRAKGWSLARIAKRLKVAQRTLVDWNSQEQEQIRTLRVIELEALREKVLATRKQELTRLKQELARLQSELAERTVTCVSTENLYRLSALLRSEMRKIIRGPASGGGNDGIRTMKQNCTVSALFLRHCGHQA